MDVNKVTLFRLFDLAILNSYILLSSLGGRKISHRDFRNTPLGNLLVDAGHEGDLQKPVGRQLAAVKKVVRFEARGRKLWSIPSDTRRRCRVCAEKGVTRNVSVLCERCEVALCCDRRCFVDYHIKADP